jgi:hypothetical protein
VALISERHQRVAAAVQKPTPAAKITIITDIKGNTYKKVVPFLLNSIFYTNFSMLQEYFFLTRTTILFTQI